VCGLLGLLLLLLVLLVGRDGPYRAEAKAAGSTGATAPIPTRLLVRDTTLLGNLAIGSCAYCMTGFAVGWLPLYLGSITGNLVQTAWLMSGILAFQALVVLTIPMLSQRLVKHGVRSRFARGWTMASCMMASGASFMAATLIVGVRAKLILVAVAVGLPAAVFPISAASISEVTPAPYRNAAVTIIFAGITIPVIFTSLATGWLVSTAGWNGALASYGVIMLAGAAAGYMLLQPERSLMRLARL
jgi:MFS family permease